MKPLTSPVIDVAASVQTLIQTVHCNPLVKILVSNMKYLIVSLVALEVRCRKRCLWLISINVSNIADKLSVATNTNQLIDLKREISPGYFSLRITSISLVD